MLNWNPSWSHRVRCFQLATLRSFLSALFPAIVFGFLPTLQSALYQHHLLEHQMLLACYRWTRMNSLVWLEILRDGLTDWGWCMFPTVCRTFGATQIHSLVVVCFDPTPQKDTNLAGGWWFETFPYLQKWSNLTNMFVYFCQQIFLSNGLKPPTRNK